MVVQLHSDCCVWMGVLVRNGSDCYSRGCENLEGLRVVCDGLSAVSKSREVNHGNCVSEVAIITRECNDRLCHMTQ